MFYNYNMGKPGSYMTKNEKNINKQYTTKISAVENENDEGIGAYMNSGNGESNYKRKP